MSPTPPSQPADRPNHRRHHRVVYRDPVEVSLIGASYDPQPRALLAEDVSENGLALTSAELFGVDTRLLMDLELVQVASLVRLVGHVIWVMQDGPQERYRLGVQFEEVSDYARIELQRLVAKRSRPR